MLSIEASFPIRESPCCLPGEALPVNTGVRQDVCRLDFSGSMTLSNCLEFEKKIVDALRDYRHVELDLAAVTDIDLYGIHLLGLLHRVAQREIIIVAASPPVASVTRRLLAGPQASAMES